MHCSTVAFACGLCMISQTDALLLLGCLLANRHCCFRHLLRSLAPLCSLFTGPFKADPDWELLHRLG